MAERCGPDFPSVLQQPFALTLYAWQQLQELDRIRKLHDRERDIYRGMLTAMAMNDPQRLDREQNDNVAAMRTPATRGGNKQRTRRLIDDGLALAERIERGRVLEDVRVSTGGV